jgi:hypothetical protein
LIHANTSAAYREAFKSEPTKINIMKFVAPLLDMGIAGASTAAVTAIPGSKKI